MEHVRLPISTYVKPSHGVGEPPPPPLQQVAAVGGALDMVPIYEGLDELKEAAFALADNAYGTMNQA